MKKVKVNYKKKMWCVQLIIIFYVGYCRIGVYYQCDRLKDDLGGGLWAAWGIVLMTLIDMDRTLLTVVDPFLGMRSWIIQTGA